MRDSLLKLFRSVRLVQEVTRSNQSSPSAANDVVSVVENSAIRQQHDDDEEEKVVDLKRNEQQVEHKETHSEEKHPSALPQQQTNQQQQQQQQRQFSCWSAAAAQPIPISFSSLASPSPYKSRFLKLPNALSSSTTNVQVNKPNTGSSRKSAKYTVRHHRTRQSSFHSTTTPVKYDHNKLLVLEEERQKSKSQKLLCLWPLPIVTRYIILIAVLVSTLNSLKIVELSCSAPSYVIHRFDFKNLILSPFLFDWTLPSLVLFGWNVLILGLFEESLSHMVGGTSRFIQLLVFLFLTVSGLRLGLGFLFSKSTGWALPILFFSNAMHECSQGIYIYIIYMYIYTVLQ